MPGTGSATASAQFDTDDDRALFDGMSDYALPLDWLIAEAGRQWDDLPVV